MGGEVSAIQQKQSTTAQESQGRKAKSGKGKEGGRSFHFESLAVLGRPGRTGTGRIMYNRVICMSRSVLSVGRNVACMGLENGKEVFG